MTEGQHGGRGRDVLAGLSVAVVLIPQSLAYAELAGVPADRGLITAAIAALVGSALGSSPMLQTGPTALASLLTLGVLAAMVDVGSDRFVALAALLAVLAGLVRLVLGLAKLGRVSYLLSPPVIAGLTTAAGVLIVASQVPALLGVPSEAANPLVAAGQALVGGAVSWPAVAVGALTIAVMVTGSRLSPRVPWPLVAIVAGGLLAAAFPDDVAAVALELPALGISLDVLVWEDLVALLVPALVVGLVGFSEAASIARNFSTRGRQRWSASRELVGQGAACTLAGVAGGFPTSGSFSRSSLAHLSGARTRLSGIVAGLAVVAILPVTGAVPPIPQPALAGLVAVAGAALVDPGTLRRLRTNTRLQFGVAVITAIATLLLAPRIDIAVLVGVLAAVGAHLFREEQLHVEVEPDGDLVRIHVHGVVFYVSAPRLGAALGRVLADHPDVRRFEIDLSGAGRIDVSGAVALEDALAGFEAIGAEVRLVGIPPHSRKVVQRILGDHVAG